MRKIQRAFLILLLVVSTGWAADGQVLDAEMQAGTNYAVAAFRFWLPPDVKVLSGVLVLVPGSNADGRTIAQEAFWQAFARRHQLGLVACWFKDHPHENMNIEEYARAGAGSGAALLEALKRFGKVASRPEVANASLLLWESSLYQARTEICVPKSPTHHSCFGAILPAASSITNLPAGNRSE